MSDVREADGGDCERCGSDVDHWLWGWVDANVNLPLVPAVVLATVTAFVFGFAFLFGGVVLFDAVGAAVGVQWPDWVSLLLAVGGWLVVGRYVVPPEGEFQD